MFKLNGKYVDDKEYERLKRLENQNKSQVKKKKKWKPKKKLKFKKVNANKFKSYSDYIKSKTWKKRRLKILKRAKGMCEECKIRKATQVHHKTYKHLFNEYPNELIALCGTCHQQKHDLLTDEDIERRSERLLIKNGFIYY